MAYENDTDKITIQGILELTKDREGLKNVLKIKRVIDAALEALRRDRKLD